MPANFAPRVKQTPIKCHATTGGGIRGTGKKRQHGRKRHKLQDLHRSSPLQRSCFVPMFSRLAQKRKRFAGKRRALWRVFPASCVIAFERPRPRLAARAVLAVLPGFRSSVPPAGAASRQGRGKAKTCVLYPAGQGRRGRRTGYGISRVAEPGWRVQPAVGPRKGFAMIQDEFVIEEANHKTILVRHLLARVRFLFVMKGRKLDGATGGEPDPADFSLRNQARLFALREARAQGWID